MMEHLPNDGQMVGIPHVDFVYCPALPAHKIRPDGTSRVIDERDEIVNCFSRLLARKADMAARMSHHAGGAGNKQVGFSIKPTQ
jgi:hypothetical protein